MDTLEWGTVDHPAGTSRWSRRGPGWLGPPVAVSLAGAGAALAIAAEVLPWVSLAQSTESTTGGLGIDNLNTISVLGYYLCWIALLGLTGLVLTGRPAARRAAAGASLGVCGALIMVLAGIIRWIFAGNGLVDPGAPTVSANDAAASSSPHLGPGLFCAGAAVGLVMAAVIVAMRRREAPGAARAGAVAVPAEVAAEQPIDLTVGPASPSDERLFARPDGRPGTLTPRD